MQLDLILWLITDDVNYTMNVNEYEKINDDKNDNIKEYLHYYLNLAHSPKFAVLINGPWGIGKTYLIKKYINQVFGKAKKRFVYISLSGLTSRSDIDREILSELYPALKGKASKFSALFLSVISIVMRWSVKVNYDYFRNVNKNSVYVFDDLERCGFSVVDALGYINHYVERYGCKVIVISNENDIDRDGKYKISKEKVIGQTLSFLPTFNDAFNFFITELKNPDLVIDLKSNFKLIKELYLQSKIHNLRSLRGAFLTLDRIYNIIPKEYKKNAEAMTAIIAISIVISLEVRHGELDASMLKSRNEYGKNSTGSKLSEINIKYTVFDISNDIISGSVLVDIFINGIIDVDSILSSLNKSSYFFIQKSEPSWITVWKFFERSNEDFFIALNDMNSKFDNRQYTFYGEYLHVFGIKLWLSRIGVYEKTHQEIIVECMKCIDDLCAENNACIDRVFNYKLGNIFGLYGYTFHDEESEEFNTIFEYFKKTANAHFIKKYNTFAIEILNKLPTDIDGFQRSLVNSDLMNGDHGSEEILSSVPHDYIIDKMISCPSEKWIKVFGVFQRRYEANPSVREMEKEWLKGLVNALHVKCEELSALDSARIKNIIKWYMEPYTK
ncbi:MULTISPECIES: P-loop NTPase fold protein [Yersinia]|uniref:P-loop NTPase fold protein n=1 Tax=Yersinia TaxID=629 RepID=UPI0005E5469C|nr:MULTISPECIES: P-loop NTPase fold protein [Yersinia]MCB5316346.1 KAP family NTPase [Yersinia massiliensis]CQH32906.1 KAP family P-loop domain [Yersinia frederiksenii]